jgi:hypothetical protein
MTKLPGPSSEYIFKQCTLHVCSGFLMWTVLFISFSYFFSLKIEGEESHARMSGMHVRMFHIFCENIKSYIMNIIHARNKYSFYPIFRHSVNRDRVY